MAETLTLQDIRIPRPATVATRTKRDGALGGFVRAMRAAVSRLEKLVDVSFQGGVSGRIAKAAQQFQELSFQYFRLATQTDFSGVPTSPAYGHHRPYENLRTFTDYFLDVTEDFLKRNELHVGDVMVRRAIVEYRKNSDRHSRVKLKRRIRPILNHRTDSGMFARLMAYELAVEVKSRFKPFETETKLRFAGALAEAALLGEDSLDEETLAALREAWTECRPYVAGKARIRYLALTLQPEAVRERFGELRREYASRLLVGQEPLEYLAREINILANGLRSIREHDHRKACYREYKAGIAGLILSKRLKPAHAAALLKKTEAVTGVSLSRIQKHAKRKGKQERFFHVCGKAGRLGDLG